MKKLLFVVPLLVASVVSFASQPQPQRNPVEKHITTVPISMLTLIEDYGIACNDNGCVGFDDGADCITVGWNFGPGSQGSWSDCN